MPPGRSPAQTLLLLAACVLAHYLVLQAFLSINATIDPRVLGAIKPFQVALIAEKPPEAAVEPPPKAPVARRPERPPPARVRPVPKPVAPVPRPKPAQDPSPAQETAQLPEPEGVATEATAVTAPVAMLPAVAAEPLVPSEPDPTPIADEPPPKTPAAPLFGVALPGPPPSGRWTYSVHMGQYNETGAAATLKLGFQHDGGRYHISAEASAVGLTAFFYSGVRKDISEGRVGDDGFEPFRYAEQRNRRAERSVTLDYHARKIVFAGGETGGLPKGAQDRLSGLFQLGLMARARPDLFEHGRTVGVDEFNLRSVERINYRVDGVVQLPTHLGTLRTLQLTRLRTGQGDEPQIEVWLDYDFWMLPVRIRLTDRDGRVIDQLIDQRG